MLRRVDVGLEMVAAKFEFRGLCGVTAVMREKPSGRASWPEERKNPNPKINGGKAQIEWLKKRWEKNIRAKETERER